MRVAKRRCLTLVLALVGLGVLAWWRRRSVPTPEIDRPADVVARPAMAVLEPPADGPATGQAWVPPVERGCPETHPVKANDNSGIFHLPGGLSYARTVPERCYDCAESAAADGYRAAKR